MHLNDEYGQRIMAMLLDGKDLPDELVLEIVMNKLKSPQCRDFGYVLDDFPTYSEKSFSISKQLEFLHDLEPKLELIIDLQVSMLGN